MNWRDFRSGAVVAVIYGTIGYIIGGLPGSVLIGFAITYIWAPPVIRRIHGRHRQARSTQAYLRTAAGHHTGPGAGAGAGPGPGAGAGAGSCSCVTCAQTAMASAPGITAAHLVNYLQQRYGITAAPHQAAAVAAFMIWDAADWDDGGQPGFVLVDDDGRVSTVPVPLSEDDGKTGRPAPGMIMTLKTGGRGNGKSAALRAQLALYAVQNAALGPSRPAISNGAGYARGGMVLAPPAATASQPPVTGSYGLWQHSIISPAAARAAHGLPPSSPPPSPPQPGRLVPVRGRGGGMPGFASHRVIPAEETIAEIPDVFGVVRGYRWWTLGAPPLDKSPAHADQVWPPSLLRGMQDTWKPGENTAVCHAGSYKRHPDSEIPSEICACGFWAYWQLQRHEVNAGGLPVCGVVEGYGAVLLGEKGFRAARARIVALHLPFTIVPVTECGDEDPLGLGLPPRSASTRANPWWNHPKFHGKVTNYGTTEVPAPLQPVPELSQASAGERQAAADAAEAWTAVIGDRLEQVYAGVQVFETRAAMEAAYPPDLSQIPDPDSPYCPGCGTAFQSKADLKAHAGWCGGS